MKNKAILITGGAKRIGRFMALDLANLGYDILLHYNNSASEAQELKDIINSIGKGKCELICGNLDKKFQCDKIIAQGIKIFPNLEILINNASIFADSAFFDTDEDILDSYINIHLKAPFWLTQSFAKQIGKGNIINILDNAIVKNAVRFFTYNLSKKMLADFTTMSAKILAPNIRVNAIAPGSVLPSVEMDQTILTEKAKKLPLQKTPTPEDIANAVKMLIDNEYLIGQIIFVDGGESLL